MQTKTDNYSNGFLCTHRVSPITASIRQMYLKLSELSSSIVLLILTYSIKIFRNDSFLPGPGSGSKKIKFRTHGGNSFRLSCPLSDWVCHVCWINPEYHYFASVFLNLI